MVDGRRYVAAVALDDEASRVAGTPVAFLNTVVAVLAALAVPAGAQSRSGAVSNSVRLLGVPEVRKELKLKKWAVWQPYVFGGGTALVSLGMITSGLQGVSRRNWDITFSGVVPGTIDLTLAIFGIGAIIAVIAVSSQNCLLRIASLPDSPGSSASA